MKLEKEEIFHYDLPKWPTWASRSSILHNLPNKNKNYLSFRLLKTTKSREERSTCYTVSVPLHLCTISRPKIIQIVSKTSRLEAFSINISSPFLVFAIFLNSGIYLTISMVVFDHSIFPNNMSPESLWKPAVKTRLRSLQDSRNVSRTKLDVRDFWPWSFGEKLELSGECYWCCNSMEGFFTRLSYFFTMDFETYTMNMRIEQRFWGTKGTLSNYF